MLVCIASLTADVTRLARVAPRLMSVSPRVLVEPRGLMWCDAHGMDAQRVGRAALELVRGSDTDDEPSIPDARAGVAQTAITAEVAAVSRVSANGRPLTCVQPGADAAFIAPHPIEVLGPSPALRTLLLGSGIETCGELAALDHESVEVRFGAEGSHVWRLARADDRRLLFPPLQRTLPEASFEWLDYVLTEPERLLFVINGLVRNVCTQLADRGTGAREMSLAFSLANRTTYSQLLHPARVTGSQRAWMRLVRSELERLELPDAVTGISLSVVALGGELGRQGDLFDRGFASALATEEAVAQLLDDRGSAVVAPRTSRHPLVERRTEWIQRNAEEAVRHAAGAQLTAHSSQPLLTLQLLPEPRAVLVETERRRDHENPVRCCLEDGWEDISCAAGPDHVSGGEWAAPFSREYFRCVTSAGRMVWLFRDPSAKWYLAGWWD